MSEGDDQLKVELDWCLARLEEKLSAMDPYSRQAQEAAKVHRILKSGKAPVIKKRQAMRNMFGDYREKMKAMEKKNLQALKKSKLVPVKEAPTASKFLRLSSGASHAQKESENAVSVASNAVDQLSVSDNSQTECENAQGPSNPPVPLSESLVQNGGDFKFQFDGSESLAKENGASASQTSVDAVPVNYFVLKPSGEDFRFDFESESGGRTT